MSASHPTHQWQCARQKMMKTDAGRRRAKSRHDFMEAYLQEFMLEWDAQA